MKRSKIIILADFLKLFSTDKQYYTLLGTIGKAWKYFILWLFLRHPVNISAINESNVIMQLEHNYDPMSCIKMKYYFWLV